MSYRFPILFEFFGLPNTGKTTTANYIVKKLNKSGKKTKIIHERASICPISDKTNPIFNYWTLFSLMKEHTEAIEDKYDIIIADRGIYDANIWVGTLATLKKYDIDYIKRFNEIVQTKYFSNLTTIGFFFYASVDEVLQRELATREDNKFGSVVNKKVLSQYMIEYKKFKENYTNIVEIDSKKMTIREIEKFILDKIYISINCIYC